MRENSEPKTYIEGVHLRLGVILALLLGATVCGALGAFIGLFVMGSIASRDLGPALSWLLGVGGGGGFGGIIGLNLMLRIIPRENGRASEVPHETPLR